MQSVTNDEPQLQSGSYEAGSGDQNLRSETTDLYTEMKNCGQIQRNVVAGKSDRN